MLIENPRGGYRFLPGIEPYSCGAVALPGHEIIHVTLHRPLPWREGFARIDRALAESGRERSALCSVELRSPAPFARQGFIDFNQGYQEQLNQWGLLLDDMNPVARTNVCPAWETPAEPVLYGFGYTVASELAQPTFIVAGAGDMGKGSLLEAPIIREGETGIEALLEKAQHVMWIMSRRLEGLGVGWTDVTATEVYTVQPMDAVYGPALLDVMGPAALHGLRWHPSQPPIQGLEFEMDVRGVATERVLFA